MARTITTIPDDLIYHVCALVLREKWPVTHVANWLRDNGYPGAKREWPNQIVGIAFERGLLTLPLRENAELALRVQDRSGAICRVAAVEDHDAHAFDTVAELAADQVVTLIRQVQADRAERDPVKRAEVHIGLAAGGTSKAFAAYLAEKLKRSKDWPQIWLHTLTSGFFVDDPDSAPDSSLGQFKGVEPTPKFVVLHAPPLVSQSVAPSVRELPMIRDAYHAARKLDIVVTSLSVAGHEHSLFKRAVEQFDPSKASDNLKKLDDQGWAGDIMWQPYSHDGTAARSDVHPITVVSFQRLIELSKSVSKHVVCIAGPCARCGQPKHAAIMPLMKCSKLRRPFSHFVTTASMAQKICDELKW